MEHVDAYSVITPLYPPGSLARYYLICHGEAVARKALEVADRLSLELDRNFLYSAAILHDVGIIFTDAKDIGCSGGEPYVRHGVLGSRYLADQGLEGHALVAERHFMLGVTARDIREQGLPFPQRDMMPLSIEERLICYADKFFSKVADWLTPPKPLERIAAKLPAYALERFIAMAEEFREPGIELLAGSRAS